MFAHLFKLYALGTCMFMLFMHRTGWRLGGDSSPLPPGVRSISRSYHGGGSFGSFFHK